MYGSCSLRLYQAYIEQAAGDQFVIQQGIFLTFEDFRNNRAIPEQFIDTSLDPDTRDFYFHLLKERYVQFGDNDTSFSVRTTTIWGYFDGKALFLNRKMFPKNEFLIESKDVSDHLWAPATVVGTICLVYYTKNFKPELRMQNLLMPPAQYPSKNKEALFFLDIRDGSILLANPTNLGKLIKSDAVLYQQFEKYKGDKDQKLLVFLNEFNRRHPLKNDGNQLEYDMDSNQVLNSFLTYEEQERINVSGMRFSYKVHFKNDSIIRIKARLSVRFKSGMDALVGADSNIIMPYDTRGITRIMKDKSEVTGFAADSCWLFMQIGGAINAYARNPNKETVIITHIQHKGSERIVALNKKNLSEMIREDPEAMSFLEKERFQKAIEVYNANND